MRRILLAATLALGVVTVIAAMLYATEAYLASEEWEIELGTTARVERAARKFGAKWDTRTQAEVIRDLRAEGRDAHPSMAPSVFTESDGLVVNGEKFFPLGGISKTTNVFCNEMGEWSIYDSDEYGFNNPVGSWTGDIDVAIIGDSFAHGACLKPGDDIASQLRRTGLRTLNLGMGGTGPLFYSAVLKEYAEPVHPKVVVWSFYAMDINDTISESTSPMLMSYLEDPSFSQGFMTDQPRVDRLLRTFYKSEYQKRLDENVARREERRKRITSRLIRNGLYLTEVRERIRNLGGRDAVQEVRVEQKLDLFEKTLRQAKERVEGWGGTFVFMYIPDWYAYGAPYDTFGIKVDKNFLLRPDVFRIAREMGVAVLDIQGEVFDKHPDPVSLFNWRMYGHYNLEGYTLLSNRLSAFLRDNTGAYQPKESGKPQQ